VFVAEPGTPFPFRTLIEICCGRRPTWTRARNFFPSVCAAAFSGAETSGFEKSATAAWIADGGA
jgi:hypothetical protein